MNIGQTLIKLKTIDRNIEYLGLEPNPVCAYYVEKFISVNRFTNTRVIAAGVSNINEIVTLNYYMDDVTDSTASIVADFRKNSKIVAEKKIIVLSNEILKLEPKIAIIKIDVEGAELMVVEGLIKVIERDRPLMIVEILPVYTAENRERLDRQNKISDLLRDLNYSIVWILKNSNGSLKGLKVISEIGINTDALQSDYLLLPKDAVNDILAAHNANIK